MKQNILITILIACLSVFVTSCGETEFSSLGSSLEKLENGDLSDNEIKDIEASDDQVDDMIEVTSDVMDPEVKEPISEVMAPDKKEPAPEVKHPEKRNSIDRVKMYLCKEEPPVKKVKEKEDDSCYLKDGSGHYVRDSFGSKVRTGSCGSYVKEVFVEEPKFQVPEYMICHAPKGKQSEGMSLCLPKAEIQAYIKSARGKGGTSYMGPCK